MAQRHSEFDRARRGFSLAELVVVMAIIATLAAVTVPRFASAGSSYKARGAAERIADSIRDAASTARARSSTVRVRLSPAGDSFNAAVLSPLEYIALYSTTERPFGADATEARFADSSGRLEIDGFGNFSTSAIFALRVGDETRTVMVDAGAGTVTTGTVADALAFRSSVRYR
jgi:prepilin-type N-terminal cleavage/methylation domain-containing protein